VTHNPAMIQDIIEKNPEIRANNPGAATLPSLKILMLGKTSITDGSIGPLNFMRMGEVSISIYFDFHYYQSHLGEE
jgi:hypothetical protein